MRLSFLYFLLLLSSCAQIPATDYDNSLGVLQEVWESQDMARAYKRIEGLKVIEEEGEFQTLGIPRESGASSLNIFFNKKLKKITWMALSVYGDKERRADFIKSKIIATDWKTYEHPVKDHPLRTEISEYSESRGVSFLYDKLDPEKEIHVVYWGSDPKKLNW